MTREQAIETAIAAVFKNSDAPAEVVVRHPLVSDIVAILEAVGLLKFEPREFFVPAVTVTTHSDRGGAAAMIREDTLIETLRMAGYEVTKRA